MFNAFQKFLSFGGDNFQKLLNMLFTRIDFLFLIEGKIYGTNYSQLNHGLRAINNERTSLVSSNYSNIILFLHTLHANHNLLYGATYFYPYKK